MCYHLTSRRVGIRNEFGKIRRHSGCDRCDSSAGDRDRIRADWAIRKEPKTGSKDRATGATGFASPSRPGDQRGAAVGVQPKRSALCHGRPCNKPRSFLCDFERRRRCLIAPAPGRPLNSSAAPDVRAPSVRGRWRFFGLFWSFLTRFFAIALWLGFPLASPDAIGYTLTA